MRLRPHRGSVIIWSSAGVPAGEYRGRQPARRRRIPWWLRASALLAVIGVLRLARFTRTRWEPAFLGAGATLMMIGFALPSASVAFLSGMLVLVVTLLKGIGSETGPRARRPTADSGAAEAPARSRYGVPLSSR